MAQVGGWSEKEPATDKIQGICSMLKSDVEKMTKKSYKEFRAIIHRRQTLDGTNHLVRVYTGEETMIDLMVFEPIPRRQGTPGEFYMSEFQLMGIKKNQKLDHPLERFTGIN